MKPELEIQKFLRARQPDVALDELAALYGIKATRHLAYPNLVLLKYHQFESPFAEPLVQECRGIILDQDAAWNVVVMSYTKFFNYAEPLAAKLDWSTARVYEKLDGSLMTLYHYAGQWHVSTSGVPDATCMVGDFGVSFGNLFWKTFTAEGYDIHSFSTEHCYAFELCAPQNRVVVRHASPHLLLHGIRDLVTLKEVHLDSVFGFKMGQKRPRQVRSFIFRTVEDCFAAARQLNPLEAEGFVACDANFNRVKIKSPAYVALHHSKDGLMSRSKVALLLRDGEADELSTALGAFPELQDDFVALRDRYEGIVAGTEVAWAHHCGIQDQKEFAIRVKDLRNSGCLFALKRGKTTSVRAYLKGLTEPAYLRLMEI